MHAPGEVERLWVRRLRWRMRGAWQWPAFALLTVLDAVLLTRLPFYEDGPGTLVAGMLLAGFANLLAVAVIGPLICSGMFVGGLLHRPAVAAERADVAVVAASTHAYVLAQAPEYRPGLAGLDAMRVEEDLYRACVPGPDPKRWLCLFVTTDQSPPGVTADPDRAPNAAYRMHGGFR